MFQPSNHACSVKKPKVSKEHILMDISLQLETTWFVGLSSVMGVPPERLCKLISDDVRR